MNWSKKGKTSVFEWAILITVIGAAFMGFRFINALYIADGHFSWEMLIAIFLWLQMLLLLIIMTLNYSSSQMQTQQMAKLSELLETEKKEIDVMSKK